MNKRIGIWALAGVTVARFWVISGLVIGPGENFGHWIMTTITAPASIFRRTPVTWYKFIALSIALYGLIGTALEIILRVLRSGRQLAHSNR